MMGMYMNLLKADFAAVNIETVLWTREWTDSCCCSNTPESTRTR